MGIVDQPKPSQPGSPVPDQQPLQPGGTTDSKVNSFSAERNNPQTPEITREESGEEEHRRSR